MRDGQPSVQLAPPEMEPSRPKMIARQACRSALRLATFSYLLVLFSTLAVQSQAKLSKKICILGAGPSGIAAATELESKGYSVAIFEKNAYVGGRTKSFKYSMDGLNYDEGAVLLTTDYTNVLRLVQRFNFKIGYENLTSYFFDPQTGFKVKSASLSTPSTTAALLQALARYVTLWSDWRFNAQNNTAAYALPIGAWLVQNKLQPLLPAFLEFVTTFGYGSLMETPTLYVLRYVTKDRIVSLLVDLRQPAIIDEPGGFQSLIQKWAGTVKGPIYLNTSIAVNRPKEGLPTVHFIRTVKGRITQSSMTCRKVIVAFPQIAKNLGFLGLDSKETAVFNQVVYSGYSTTLIDVGATGRIALDQPSALYGILNGTSLSEPPGNGGPVAITTKAGRRLTTLYSWNRNTRDLSSANAQSTAFATLAKLGPGTTLAQLGPTAIKDFQLWDYFPHASSAAIAAGFETKLHSLQGYRKTYYTGSLLKFDDVEDSIQASIDLIDTFF